MEKSRGETGSLISRISTQFTCDLFHQISSQLTIIKPLFHVKPSYTESMDRGDYPDRLSLRLDQMHALEEIERMLSPHKKEVLVCACCERVADNPLDPYWCEWCEEAICERCVDYCKECDLLVCKDPCYQMHREDCHDE